MFKFFRINATISLLVAVVVIKISANLPTLYVR